MHVIISYKLRYEYVISVICLIDAVVSIFVYTHIYMNICICIRII